jgi:hypothetical protein
VRSRETSESEPSMKCRKRMDGVKTGGGGHPGTSLGGDLKTGPSGTRLEGGVNLGQALSRNVGTCRCDVKGEDQVGNPREILSTDARHRGRTVRSSDEGPVMGLERRGCGVLPWRAVNRLTGGTA